MIILLTAAWQNVSFLITNLPQVHRKVSSLAQFCLELDCEDYSILDQTVEVFLHGLGSIFMDSVNTLELDTSFDQHDSSASSVSLCFLRLVSTLSDSSKLQLAPSIKYCKLWCNIVLNVGKKKSISLMRTVYQSLSYFATDINAAAVSFTRIAIVCTGSSRLDSDGEVIPVSEGDDSLRFMRFSTRLFINVCVMQLVF